MRGKVNWVRLGSLGGYFYCICQGFDKGLAVQFEPLKYGTRTDADGGGVRGISHGHGHTWF